MTNEEKVKILKDFKDNNLKDVTKCVEMLDKMGDLKRDYAEILKWEEFRGLDEFDKAVEKYADSDDYDVLSALLTFLTREEVVDFGAFAERAEKGDVGKVVDRMITILTNGTNGLARERMIKNN